MITTKAPFNRLIIVAYRLPFALRSTPAGVELVQNSGGLVSAVLAMADQIGSDSSMPIHWIGHGDSAWQDQPDWAFENDQFVVHPVFMSDEIHKGYYEGFCNELIWPLFHYFPSYASFQESHFDHYQQANTLFLEELTALIEPGDLVWIHDFQLMLLPQLLRQAMPQATIGYFFHIPFPTYEIVKLLPRGWRQALLEGVLGADVIGFHTTDYVQHFLQSVGEVLGLPVISERVVESDRSVTVRNFPISIDFNKFNAGGQAPEVVSTRRQHRKLLRKNKIIFSVDRLDYAKGITYRLQGYERFLIENPQWHNKATFVMTVVPSRDKIGHYQEIKREIEETVGRINGRFGTIGWRPIVYSYMSLSFTELLSLYTGCDVALITPIRDGMNLVCKEFVASRHDECGVLILSELAGAAQELRDALIINPTDTQEVASAIRQALTMPADEQMQRMRPMRQHLQNHDVFRWTANFLTAVKEAVTQKPPFETNLPVQPFISAFEQAQKRLLLLDFAGTLAPLISDPAQARLSKTMEQLVNRLAEEAETVIISGRNRAFLEKTFATLPVQLVAEHGAFIKRPGQAWQVLALSTTDWVEPVRSLMNHFANEHPESFIEEKETAIAWHYRRVTQEDIEAKAIELANQLRQIPAAVPLTVIQGSKVVEVKPAQHTKGTIALSLVDQTPYDFIVSMGDDTTDEDMFQQLPNWAYTIKVGAGSTFAWYRIARQQDVERLLRLMNERLLDVLR